MEKFADVLSGVLDKLGIAAAYLWPKAVLYTVATAVAEIVGAVLIGALLLVTSWQLRRRANERERDTSSRYDDETTAAMRIVAWFLCVLGPLLMIAVVSRDTPTLISPEYATVRDLIGSGQRK